MSTTLTQTGAQVQADLDNAEIAITTSNTGITSNGDMLLNGGVLTRSAHELGHLEGRGNNDFKTSPIYTISSSANPNDADLNAMYGLGFSHTNSSFLNKYAGNGAGWGAYVAAAGVAKIFLNGSNGSVNIDGTYYGTSLNLSGDALLGGNLTRSAFNVGHLEGGHNNIGNSSTKTNPIFTMGSSFNPDDSTLNNMYGTGWGNSDASFLSGFGVAANKWGQYISVAGVATLYQEASSGTYYGSGAVLGITKIGGTTPTPGTNEISLAPNGFPQIHTSVSGTSSISHLVFVNSNGTVGSISTSGNATSFNVSSDERLKENFEPLNDAFELVKSIVESNAIQYFNFKSDPSTKVPGFVAQRLIACGAGGMVAEGEGSLDLNVEIGTVYQEAVTEQVEITEQVKDEETGEFSTVGTGEFETKVITHEKRVTPCGVDQSKAVPHLMQLCYDQQLQINTLSAQVAELIKKIT